jgi:hypothetical protein
MLLTETIRNAWGWTGIDPLEVIGENDFGNLIVKDVHGQYWRICPEDCYCQVIAENREELDRLSADQDFLRDWHMSSLVDDAFHRLGALPDGRKYCLKIPAVLGGEYGGDNLAMISTEELIRVSGYIAHQIEHLPDGATIKLSIED